MLFAAVVALMVMAGSSSAAAQAPCAVQHDAPDLYQWHTTAGCAAGPAAAGCTRDWAGDGYYTKDTTCDATAGAGGAGCHRTYASERGEPTAYDEIDCSAGAGGATARCSRTDVPGGGTDRAVTDDCAVGAGPVQRDVSRSEGSSAPELPDDPLSF
jgi:hypothetical protein